MYVYASRQTANGRQNQILRLTDSGGVGTGLKLLYQGRAADIHNGGRILFGPDERLYAVVGERQEPASAQNLGNPYGKILRMTRSEQSRRPTPSPAA